MEWAQQEAVRPYSSAESPLPRILMQIGLHLSLSGHSMSLTRQPATGWAHGAASAEARLAAEAEGQARPRRSAASGIKQTGKKNYERAGTGDSLSPSPLHILDTV